MNVIKEPKMIKGGRFIDDRGILVHNNNLDFAKSDIKRSYTIKHNQLGYIRSYHGHSHESKFLQVTDGIFKVIAIPLEEFKVDNRHCVVEQRRIRKKYPPFFLEDNGDVLSIPAGYAHGFQNLTNSGIITFYSDMDIEDSLNDDIRFNWDFWGSNMWSLKEYR